MNVDNIVYIVPLKGVDGMNALYWWSGTSIEVGKNKYWYGNYPSQFQFSPLPSLPILSILVCNYLRKEVAVCFLGSHGSSLYHTDPYLPSSSTGLAPISHAVEFCKPMFNSICAHYKLCSTIVDCIKTIFALKIPEIFTNVITGTFRPCC